MPKRQALFPTQDAKRRVTKPAARIHGSPAASRASNHANQASRGGRQQRIDCHRLRALVPYLQVAGHRRSESGAVEVKIEWPEWVDQTSLEKLESGLEHLAVDENLAKETTDFNRPPIKQGEDSANQAMKAALAKYKTGSWSSRIHPGDTSVPEQPAPHQYKSPQRANFGFVVLGAADHSHELTQREESNAFDNSASDLEDSESDSENGGLSEDSLINGDSDCYIDEGELSENSLFDTDPREERDLQEARALRSTHPRLVDTRGSASERGKVV